MILRLVQKSGCKNFGKIMKIDENKRFCSKNCQNEWQRNVNWEDRVGIETAEKIRKDTSERVSGEKNPSKNKDIADKISESLKSFLNENPRLKEKNPFYGKQHSEETKKFLSESKKGKWAYNEEQYQKLCENTPKKENHPNWNGGSSYLPYDNQFDKKLKKDIKQLDNYKCSVCGKPTQKLSIHHIDYNKLNTDIDNLVSTCTSCHSKTNYGREKWKLFFEKYIQDGRK
jgi:hypothetical protein